MTNRQSASLIILSIVVFFIISPRFDIEYNFILFFVIIISGVISILILSIYEFLENKFNKKWLGYLWIAIAILVLSRIAYKPKAVTVTQNDYYPCKYVTPEDRQECLEEYYTEREYDPFESQSATVQAELTEFTQEQEAAYLDTNNNDSACPSGCTFHKSGCDIKGNISSESGERIYHIPGQEYYNLTKIDPQYGERWFCTETEAKNNGWRKSLE